MSIIGENIGVTFSVQNLYRRCRSIPFIRVTA
jgi:hypothetical protein